MSIEVARSVYPRLAIDLKRSVYPSYFLPQCCAEACSNFLLSAWSFHLSRADFPWRFTKFALRFIEYSGCFSYTAKGLYQVYFPFTFKLANQEVAIFSHVSHQNLIQNLSTICVWVESSTSDPFNWHLDCAWLSFFD